MTFIEVVAERFMNKQISIHFVDEEERLTGVITGWGENFIEMEERIINTANITYIESAQPYQSPSTRKTTREITGY